MTASTTFANAPVTQAIISVPIDPLQDLHAAHVGAFWSAIDDGTLSRVAEFVPRAAAVERFDEPDPIDLDVDFAYGEAVEVPRVVLSGPDSPWYLAIQEDLIEVSWIKKKGLAYPRFPELLGQFELRLSQWSRFVEERGIGKVQPIQSGFTYNNRLPRGESWRTPEDLRSLFLLPPDRGVEGELEVFHYADHSAVRDDDGTRRRVHLNFLADFTDAEQATANLTITCRGPLAANDRPLGEQITMAHDYALRAFLHFTTNKAHTLWELQA